MAVLLTLFLGWIGLAIVYFGQTKTRGTMEGVAARVAAAPAGAPAPVPRTPAPTPRSAPSTTPSRGEAGVSVEDADVDPVGRLRRLDRLHSENLLSDREYQQQRQRILDSL